MNDEGGGMRKKTALRVLPVTSHQSLVTLLALMALCIISAAYGAGFAELTYLRMTNFRTVMPAVVSDQ